MSQKKDKMPLFNENEIKVVEPIFNSPNKTFHVRLLEAQSLVSTTTVRNYIDNLARRNIVLIENTPLTQNIRANTDSESYRFYKRLFNLGELKNSGLLDKLIELFNNPESIVLFGSYSKGEDIENSDIDILVISSNGSSGNLDSLMSNYEKLLKRKISLHILPNLTKSSNDFKNSIANGIVLHGYTKVI
jgi:predicted nucleotidyltransferase